MPARVLWTGLFALLAWLPLWRGEARLARGDVRERIVASSVAFDDASDTPGRVVRPTWATLPTATQRKPSAPHGLPVIAAAVAPRLLALRTAPQQRHVFRAWSGFRARRLIAPHDALAPPVENR
jgi:hypothetical protein